MVYTCSSFKKSLKIDREHRKEYPSHGSWWINVMLVVLEIESEVYGCLGYQVWRLTMEGKLLHKGSGFCAAPLSSEGTRTWVARGSSG